MGASGRRSLIRLLASWVAWWVILAAWKLGPAVPALRRVSGAHGSVNISFGDGGFNATITEGTAVAWHGEISFLAFLLLVGIPPLILWALWLRRETRARHPLLIDEGAAEVAGTRRGDRVEEELRRKQSP